MTCTKGQLRPFSQLKQRNVTTDKLIDWLIPFSVIERYASYLISTSIDSNDNTTICQCFPSRIGTKCEYKLTKETVSISQVIQMQLNGNNEIQKESELPASFVNEISCNTSTLNLEWRQICDGIVNCQNAADELDCHLLEFNKCNTDEFQCRNGMCIPKEFLFDAVPDCMDLSDEQELSDIYQVYNRCPKMSTVECDERLCRKDEFSCGDGQCVKWSSLIDHQVSCENWRDATYFCETPDFVITNHLIANAICSPTSLQIPQLTNTSSCLISLRYLLLTTGEQQLSKMRKMAINNIKDRCLETLTSFKSVTIHLSVKFYLFR
ncbi:unnamed protein product [Rotaria sp. Silwood2]|nr:unnamed protein product [Rotaria sp. Silwood2]